MAYLKYVNYRVDGKVYTVNEDEALRVTANLENGGTIKEALEKMGIPPNEGEYPGRTVKTTFGDYFLYQPEEWSAEVCAKKSRHVARDGYGTPYPWPGYIGSSSSIPPAIGQIRWKGCTSINGRNYRGEIHPYPIVAPGYTITHSSWGYRIEKV